MHREHAGLGAKANDGDEQNDHHDRGRHCHGGSVQRAARDKNGSVCIRCKIEDAQEAHGRTGNGVDQIFEAGSNGVFGHLMENQRDREQRHHFEIQIHGDCCAGKSKRIEGCEREQIEHVVASVMAFMLHVPVRIKHRDRPHDRKEHAEKAGKHIAFEHQRETVCQTQECPLGIAAQGCDRGKDTVCKQYTACHQIQAFSVTVQARNQLEGQCTCCRE